MPENLPDLAKELLLHVDDPDTYFDLILELGTYGFHQDAMAVANEALQKYPQHPKIEAIKAEVDKIDEEEFDTLIRVASDLRSVNKALLRKRLDQELWKQCPECNQVYTTAKVLLEDKEAQRLGLATRRADARRCHRNCRSLNNKKRGRE